MIVRQAIHLQRQASVQTYCVECTLFHLSTLKRSVHNSVVSFMITTSDNKRIPRPPETRHCLQFVAGVHLLSQPVFDLTSLLKVVIY
jgi:hypothetical protein